MQAQGFVGPQTQTDGAVALLRQGRLGELVNSESVGKYYELGRRGQIYGGSIQAATSFGTALTATAVTLTLYNPLGSQVNLALLQVACSISTITTATNAISMVYAASLGMSTGLAPTVVTAAKTVGGLLQVGTGASAVGQLYTAATLGATAPVAVRTFPLGFSLDAGIATGVPFVINAVDYVDGALSLGPGVAVTLQAIGTVAPSGVASFVWAEIPN